MHTMVDIHTMYFSMWFVELYEQKLARKLHFAKIIVIILARI